MQALHDVVQAGYVRYIGMSSCHAWQCAHVFVYPFYDNEVTDTTISTHSPCYAKYAHSSYPAAYLDSLRLLTDYAITNKLTPFISMQNHYNLVYREEERKMMPTLKHFGVGCIPWGPLARGYVCRLAKEATTRGETDR